MADSDWWKAAPVASSMDVALAEEGVTGARADFVRSIYSQESSSGKNAKTSNAGAVGGMQILPGTFREVAEKDWDIGNEGHNLRAGIRYALKGLDAAEGDPALGAAHYYGGPRGLTRARQGIAVSDPRNPNAPTTLQYGQQVASRMKRSPVAEGVEAMVNSIVPAAQAAEPQGNWWDAAPVVSQEELDAPPAERSSLTKIGRQVGLTARAGMTGLASLAEIGTEPIRRLVVDPIAALASGDAPPPQTRPLRAVAESVADSIGLPKPEDATERVVQDVAGAMIGGGGFAGAGGVLSRAAGKFMQAAGKIMAAGPGLQIASSGASGGAAGVTRESGGSETQQVIAGLVGGLAVPAAAAKRAPGKPSPTIIAAQKAREAGYTIPPADIAPGNTAIEIANGLAGKIKTAQSASARNQVKTNELARKALGLPEGAELTPDTLHAFRGEVARAYAPVAGAGTVVPTKVYSDALDDAIKPFLSQANSFPGRKLPEVVADIQSLRTAQFDAGDALQTVSVLRADADAAFRAGRNLDGRAYKGAASALEDALGTHLQTSGAPKDVLDNFREARKTIARSYSVQSALRGDGNVDAGKLAGQLARGKPLTDELRQVAEISGAFPRATQALKESPKALSPLDFFVPAMSAVSSGSPKDLALVAARPVMRSISLSDPVQKYAISSAQGGARQAKPGGGGAGMMAAARAAQGPAAGAPDPELVSGSNDWGIPVDQETPTEELPTMTAPDAAPEAPAPTPADEPEAPAPEPTAEAEAELEPLEPVDLTEPEHVTPVAADEPAPRTLTLGETLRERAMASKGVQPGDILNAKAQPFTVKLPAIRAAKEAGPGHEVVEVRGGFVVRQVPAEA